MGNQLWTSPDTGYRRRGTRIAEVISSLETGVTTSTIVEQLRCWPEEAPSEDTKAELERLGFDVAGVACHEAPGVRQFVRTADLKGGRVRDFAQPIRAEHLLAASTPLGQLLPALEQRTQAFVLDGAQVYGIVTRADLNKPPVRLYLFGLITMLEMHMSFWIHRRKHDSWAKSLTAGRLERVTVSQARLRKEGLDLPAIDCLEFCDRARICTSDKALRESLQLGSKTQAESQFARAEKLRNKLAHSHLNLASGETWKDLIKSVAFIEAVVRRSDALVESPTERA